MILLQHVEANVLIVCLVCKPFLMGGMRSELVLCPALRSHHSLCPVKMKIPARAATTSPPTNSPLSTSMWMSPKPAPRSHSRWPNLSKQSQSLRSPLSRSTMLWRGSDSLLPPLMFQLQWMSALVSCKCVQKLVIVQLIVNNIVVFS